MEKLKKIIMFIIILVAIFNMKNINYATSFSDFEYGPGSAGMADLTDEKAEQEKQKSETNTKTAEDYIGKSSNNYLKTLKIENAKIEPEFNRQYTDYKIILNSIKDKTINIIAEPEDKNAKIEGNGKIKIDENKNNLRVIVTAENGDIQIYELKISYSNSKQEEIKTEEVNTSEDIELEQNEEIKETEEIEEKLENVDEVEKEEISKEEVLQIHNPEKVEKSSNRKIIIYFLIIAGICIIVLLKRKIK